MTRTMPWARAGRPVAPANQRPLSRSRTFVAVASPHRVLPDRRAWPSSRACEFITASKRLAGESAAASVAASAGKRSRIGELQHRHRIGAPDQIVALDRPLVGHFADRRHDPRRIERRRRDGCGDRVRRRAAHLGEYVGSREHVRLAVRHRGSADGGTGIAILGHVEPFWESRVAPSSDKAAPNRQLILSRTDKQTANRRSRHRSRAGTVLATSAPGRCLSG